MKQASELTAHRRLVDAVLECVDLGLMFGDRELEQADIGTLSSLREDLLEPLLSKIDKQIEELASLARKEGEGLPPETEWMRTIVNLEVGSVRGALGAVRDLSNPTRIVANHSGCLHRVQRALMALESSLRSTLGLRLEPRLVSILAEQLWRSIETRLAYGLFRTRLGSEPPVSEEELRRSFRTAGVQLASLVESDVYAVLRASDRDLFRDLQTRILSWLSEEEPDLKEGQEIWQDLNGFASLLPMVNNRSQLIAYDRVILSRCLDQLRDRPDGDEHLAELRWVWGRDAALDKFAENGAVLSRDACEAAVRGVLNRLPSLSGDGNMYTEEVYPEVLDELRTIRASRKTIASRIFGDAT